MDYTMEHPDTKECADKLAAIWEHQKKQKAKIEQQQEQLRALWELLNEQDEDTITALIELNGEDWVSKTFPDEYSDWNPADE